MTIPTTWLGIAGGGAIIGLVAGCWGQVKALFLQLKALFFVTHHLAQPVAEALLGYMSKHYTALPRTYTYLDDTTRMYSLARGKRCLAAYEGLLVPEAGVVFIKGWRVAFISGGTRPTKDTSTPVSITYLRGAFRLNELVRKALEWYNDHAGEKTFNRFFVRELFGRLEADGTKSATDAEPKSDHAPDGLFDFERKFKAGLYRLVGYRDDELAFSVGHTKPLISYLAFPQGVLDSVDEIRIWRDSKEWYRERGIPWKRGWLLHGKPGCGKSALIRAIGEQLDLPIYVFHLVTMTNTDLVQAWQQTAGSAPCIALFEDIDSVFDGRTNLSKNASRTALSFDTLLNCIDGIGRNDGIFTIFTTNNIAKLDPALGVPKDGPERNGSIMSTRPGRVDRTIELKEMDEECRRKLAGIILADCPERVDGLVAAGGADTGAQFSERCIRLALADYWKRQVRPDKHEEDLA